MLDEIISNSAVDKTATALHYLERGIGTKPDAKLYDISVPIGKQLAAGEIHRLQLADSLMLVSGDDRHREIARNALGKLATATPSEVQTALAVNSAFSLSVRPTIGHPLESILSCDLQSMHCGSDTLGSRSDIDHITVGPSGINHGDSRNDLHYIAAQADINSSRGKPHMLILEDGSVQGPADGGVPFNQNAPFDRRGRKGDGIAVMYAGSGAPNILQKQAIEDIQTWIQTERNAAGHSGSVHIEGNNPDADKLLQLQETPRNLIKPQMRPQLGGLGASP